MKIESTLPIFTGFYGTVFEPDETDEIYDNVKKEWVA